MTRSRDEPVFTVRAAARLTGLTPDTLRAWERRHQAVVPGRNPRGRAYSANDIDRLRLLRTAVQHGHSIGTIASLPTVRLAQLAAVQPAAATAAPAAAPPTAPLLEAVRAYDAGRVERELGRLAAALTPRDLVFDVVLPVLRVIGDEWEQGRLRAGQEHLLSTAIRHVLGGILRVVSPHPVRNGAVFATLPGERHEFGILAAALLAAARGVPPIVLGADLPPEEIAEAAVRSGAALVVVGFTVPPGAPAAGQLRALRRRLPAHVALWAGGSAVPSVSGVDVCRSHEAFDARLAHMA